MHSQKNTKALASLLGAMLIFGSVGVFAVRCALPPALTALARAVIGAAFLFVVLAATKKGFTRQSIRANLLWLLLGGAALGINWVLLFTAYRYTSVASATLCYYMAPVFVLLFTALLPGERLTLKKLLCSAFAVAGAVLLSLPQKGEAQDLRGIFFGLCAALFYCAVILINRRIRQMPVVQTTALQLLAAAAVLLPYVLFTGGFSAFVQPSFAPASLLLLGIMGVVHTGIAYLLYFYSIPRLPAQKIAVFSYLDPVSAIAFSALFLGQAVTSLQLCGMVLILGAAAYSELFAGKTKL